MVNFALTNELRDPYENFNRKTFEFNEKLDQKILKPIACLLYTSPSPRDRQKSRMPSSA